MSATRPAVALARVRRASGAPSDVCSMASRYLIHYLSQFTMLEPGDIINTGTPSGVALGMADPAYLKPGDVVELGITGLGQQRQTFLAAPWSTDHEIRQP